VTTHWAVAEQLARAYPLIKRDADAIHVRDGRLRAARRPSPPGSISPWRWSRKTSVATSQARGEPARDVLQAPRRPVCSSAARAKRRLRDAPRCSRFSALSPRTPPMIWCRQARRARGPEPAPFRTAVSTRVGMTPGSVGGNRARLPLRGGSWRLDANAPKQVAVQCGFANRGHAAPHLCSPCRRDACRVIAGDTRTARVTAREIILVLNWVLPSAETRFIERCWSFPRPISGCGPLAGRAAVDVAWRNPIRLRSARWGWISHRTHRRIPTRRQPMPLPSIRKWLTTIHGPPWRDELADGCRSSKGIACTCNR